LNMLIVNMYLCQLFFTSIKSADFQLRCAI
jgi:hypothetical protein